mgnify:CR=1 FL=1
MQTLKELEEQKAELEKKIAEAKRLPDKPSELIRVALEDVKKVENTPGYKVDLREWNVVHSDGKCHVCLGGSVLVERCGAKKGEGLSKSLENGTIDSVVYSKLTALDMFRLGDVEQGLSFLGITVDGLPEYLLVTDYIDRDGFFRDMENMARMFEARGL